MERLPRQVGDGLPVCKAAVDTAVDGGEVLPPLGTVDRRTDEFPFPYRYAVLPARTAESPQVVGPYLVAECPAAAVDGYENLPLVNAVRIGGQLVIDCLDPLHLEVVVPRAEGPHLFELPLLGLCRV